MMMSALKSVIIDFHKSKCELESMDDELPLLIYVVVHSKMENILAELNLIQDFIDLDPKLDDESRLLLNVSVTIQYVVKEWERDEIKFRKQAPKPSNPKKQPKPVKIGAKTGASPAPGPKPPSAGENGGHPG